MAASFGLAGITACRRPVTHILPQAKGVEDYVHGQPVYYATAMSIGGETTGLLVEAHDGRPTKVEGNPEHPFSLGAASAWHQASILGLYDPDRSQSVLNKGSKATWDDFAAFAKTHFEKYAGAGDGIRVLSQPVHSPSLAAVRRQFFEKFPKAKWVEYEPFDPAAAAEGAALAFGQPVSAHPQFDKADLVISLDCDFLGVDSGSILPLKAFSRRRRVTSPEYELNRLYAVESQYSITGGQADHRLRLRAGEVRQFAADLARELGLLGDGLNVVPQQVDRRRKFVAALARDMKAHHGKCLVVAGPRQPKEVHAIAHLINQTFGTPGETVTFTKPDEAFPGRSMQELKGLAGELARGLVHTVVILGGNPAFDGPADLNFQTNLKRAATSIYVGPEENETAEGVTWLVPEAHYLESWGDVAASDGTVSIQQPLVEPLFGGKTQAEVLAAIAGTRERRAYDIVRANWLAQFAGDQEKAWRKAVHDGVVPHTRAAEVKPSIDAKRLAPLLAAAEERRAENELEVAFYASATIYDGRFANNAWLQETPEPMTKLTWDNAALLSPATAKALNVTTGDVVALKRGDRIVEVPVQIQPGHADGAISLQAGYGRRRCGRVGLNVGHDVYPLRTSEAMAFARGVTLTKTQNTFALVTTQEHHTIDDGRPIVRETTIAEYRKNSKVIAEKGDAHPPLLSLHREYDYTKGHQWGMAIDLTACVGCNACLLACQAENNIPVVGKEQVARGREMQWIRMDRYYSGSMDEPESIMEPVLCQQCENAPCESVCPVAATTHSPEGLNDMAYNRCVGTRYCSNNCPYKVRRFNFFNWHKNVTEVNKMAFNPDVTVRMRGVMEKCTYCVQRIQDARVRAKADGHRPIRDGEVTPACAQTCPAEAIVFGNINDSNSRVAKLRAQDRNYVMLEELNTKPRTSYLAKIRNQNPELA
jgi:molybdopterin-containing oxidoreductase family iron-sulfur binding subunit